jgi:hypothetical protein
MHAHRGGLYLHAAATDVSTSLDRAYTTMSPGFHVALPPLVRRDRVPLLCVGLFVIWLAWFMQRC